MSVPAPGWFWPANATRAHYMVNGRSLCGKWATFGSYGLSQQPDTTPCKECERQLKRDAS